jgi:hypothetical protein
MSKRHWDAIRKSNLYELKGLAKPLLCNIAYLIIDPPEEGEESVFAPDQIGWCIASSDYLAANMGCNPKALRGLMRMFVDDEWLTAKPFRDARGYKHVYYTITDGQLKAIVAQEMKKDENGDFVRAKNPNMSRKDNINSQSNWSNLDHKESTSLTTSSVQAKPQVVSKLDHKKSQYKTMHSLPSSDLGEEKSKTKSTDKSKTSQLRSLVSCPGDFVSGAPPPTARLTLDLADWLGLSRVDYCFHYHRDSSLGQGTEGNQDKAESTAIHTPVSPIETPPVAVAPLYVPWPLKQAVVEDFLKMGCPQEALDDLQRWKHCVSALNNNEMNPFKAYATMAVKDNKRFGKLWMPHYLLTVSETMARDAEGHMDKELVGSVIREQVRVAKLGFKCEDHEWKLSEAKPCPQCKRNYKIRLTLWPTYNTVPFTHEGTV